MKPNRCDELRRGFRGTEPPTIDNHRGYPVIRDFCEYYTDCSVARAVISIVLAIAAGSPSA